MDNRTMSKHYGYSTLAMQSLEKAGHKVTVEDGVIPGLWNVDGLAGDVTTNQLFALAERHGASPFTLPSPIRIGNVA